MNRCLALLLGFLATTVQAQTISSTAILFRHGQRTPDQTIGVLRSETADDFGLGYLTQYGSWQQYENGLFLRYRYLHLFPEDGYFRSRYLRLMTSIPDRTIMSMQSFMAGIFPPPIKDLKLPIVWQPFSSTIDLTSKYLHFKPEACPTYFNIYNDLSANPPADVLAWFEEDKEQIEILSGHIGTNVRSVVALYYIGDFVRTNLFLGDSVPDWALEAYNTFLPKYTKRFFQMAHETEFLTKVRGGPVLTQIVENMEARISGSSEARNFMIYSAHDMTVESLTRVLGVRAQTPELVNYADTVLIELVENAGAEWQVQALYVDNSGALPNRFSVDVPGCGKLCNFSQFKAAVANYLVEDYEAMCGL